MNILDRIDRHSKGATSLLRGRDPDRSTASNVSWRFEGPSPSEYMRAGKDFYVPFATVLCNALAQCPAIASNADYLAGTPRVAGTRVPVHMILDAVRYYGNVDGVLQSYPNLKKEHVEEALSFAALVLEQPIE